MNKMVEKTMTVTNDKGNQVEVVCVEHPTEGIKPVENQEHAFCLTCGTKNSNILELHNVQDTEGLKTWLREMEHYVKPEHNVLLCIFCGYGSEDSNSNSEKTEE
jgi:hypothetical protein